MNRLVWKGLLPKGKIVEYEGYIIQPTPRYQADWDEWRVCIVISSKDHAGCSGRGWGTCGIVLPFGRSGSHVLADGCPVFPKPSHRERAEKCKPMDGAYGVIPSRQEDDQEETSLGFSDVTRYMQASGELPGMRFNVLPSVRAAWLQRFLPPIGRQIPLALQDMRRAILSAETIRS